jgi:hypothetical protein
MIFDVIITINFKYFNIYVWHSTNFIQFVFNEFYFFDM